MRLLPEVLKSLFKRPFTRKYPKVQPPLPDTFKGKHIYDRDKCIGCGNCFRNCPTKAIHFLEKKKKVEFDLFHCTFCGLCAEVCPVNCIRFEKKIVTSKEDTDLFVK